MIKLIFFLLITLNIYAKNIVNLHTDKKGFYTEPFLSGVIVYNMYNYPVIILELDYKKFDNFIYNKKIDKFFDINSEVFIVLLQKHQFINSKYFYFVVKDINEKKIYKSLMFKIKTSILTKYNKRDFDKNDKKLLNSNNIKKYELLSAYDLLKTFKIVTTNKNKIQVSNKYTKKYNNFIDNFSFTSIGELENKIIQLNKEKESLKTNIWYYCQKGDLKKVKLYVRLRYNINAKDNKYNQTCLQYASLNGHYKIAKFLLEHGADVNFHNPNSENAYLAAKRLGYTKIANLLEPYSTLKTRYIKSNGDYGLPKNKCYLTSSNPSLYNYCKFGSCNGFVSNYALYQLCKYNDINGFHSSNKNVNIYLYLKNSGYLSSDYFSSDAVYRSGQFNKDFQSRKNFILYLLSGMVLMKY